LAKSNHSEFWKSVQKNKRTENLELTVIHADADVRAQAVKKLIARGVKQWKVKGLKPSANLETYAIVKRKLVMKKRGGKSAEEFGQDGLNIPALLKPRFQDDDDKVVFVLLSAKLKRLLKIFTRGSLAAGLIFVLQKKNSSRLTTKKCVRKLCGLLMKLKSKEKDVKIKQNVSPILF